MPFDLMRGFQAGEALGSPPSALASLVRAFNAQYATHREQQMKVRGELDLQRQLLPMKEESEVRVAKAKAQAEAEANPFYSLIRQQMGGPQPGGSATPGQSGHGGLTVPRDMVVTGWGPSGPTMESPTAKGMLTQASEQAKRAGQVLPEVEAFQTTLKQMTQLGRSIPAPQKGAQRFAGIIANKWQGATQELPQAALVERKRKAVVGNLVRLLGGERSSRLSDQDVQRVLGLLTNPVGDTQDMRDLSNVELVDAMNALPEVQQIGGVSHLNILTPQEIVNGRYQQNPKRGKGRLVQDPEGNYGIKYPNSEQEDLR